MGRLTSLPSAVITDDSALGGAVLERSLRFNTTDSAYLSRTPSSAGNRKTYTISAWVKRSSNGGTHPIFTRYTANNDAGFLGLYLNSDDYIYFTGWSTVYLKSNRLYRDGSSWSHIVLVVDTTQGTASDRIKLYFNGELQTLATYNAPSQNADLKINEASAEHMIGRYSNSYFNGYMAELNFIDGIALDASHFGYTEFQTGIWRPKGYYGSYNTNGFRLDFSDNSAATASTLGKDRSGQGNDFTPTNFTAGDLITNGDFSSDSDWTKDSSWSIANGKATNSGGGEIYQTISVVSGKTYFMRATIDFTGDSSVNNTTIGFRDTGNSQYYAAGGSGYTTFTANAVNQLYVKWTSNVNGNVRARCYSTDAITIDNWTVKEEIAIDSFPITPTKQSFASYETNDSVTDAGSGKSYRQGGYTVYNTGAIHAAGRSSFPVNSGKWYAEFTLKTYSSRSGSTPYIGAARVEWMYEDFQIWIGNVGTAMNASGATYRNGNSFSGGGVSYSAGDIISVAIDLDNGKQIWWAKNGTYINSGNPATTTGGHNIDPLSQSGFYVFGTSGWASTSEWEANFGQRPFSYSVPAGFKTLQVDNLPDRTQKILRPQKHFETLLYTGDGSSNNRVTGLEFKPDLVWIKSRSTTDNHILQDSVRGNFILYPNLTNGDGATGGGWVKSLNHDGFTTDVNGPINTNGHNYVAWCWKAGGTAVTNNDGSIASQVSANTEAGFSICTWTGTGSNLTFGHGLGKKPAWVITKARTGSSGCDWFVYHKEIGATHNLRLNKQDASSTASDLFNNTEPTSSVFSIGNSSCINENGGTYVSYCWAEIPGYSKMGIYRANGSSDGTFQFTGFRPALVLLKRITDGSNYWELRDNKRDPLNPASSRIFPNTNDTDSVGEGIDMFGNGFKLRNTGTGSNNNGKDYAYIAFAEQPQFTPYDTQPNAR